jgi:hypothetical protein
LAKRFAAPVSTPRLGVPSEPCRAGFNGDGTRPHPSALAAATVMTKSATARLEHDLTGPK